MKSCKITEFCTGENLDKTKLKTCKHKIYASTMIGGALAIVETFSKMHPNLDLSDLNQAFPREMYASVNKYPLLLGKIEDIQAAVKGDSFGEEDIARSLKNDIYFTLSNGAKIAFYCMFWTKDNWGKLVKQAQLYGITVEEDMEKGKETVKKFNEMFDEKRKVYVADVFEYAE